MTIYVDKITMDFNTHGHEVREPLARRRECSRGSAEPNPNHCERQCVRCKKYKNPMCFKRYYLSKTSRYVMQYRYTVTCCECLDGMKQYNNTRKNDLKG